MLRPARLHPRAEARGHDDGCERAGHERAADREGSSMAGAGGFEPPITGPKPAALPLGYAPSWSHLTPGYPWASSEVAGSGIPAVPSGSTHAPGRQSRPHDGEHAPPRCPTSLAESGRSRPWSPPFTRPARAVKYRGPAPAGSPARGRRGRSSSAGRPDFPRSSRRPWQPRRLPPPGP